jgi:hypothetical protein
MRQCKCATKFHRKPYLFINDLPINNKDLLMIYQLIIKIMQPKAFGYH